MTDERPTTGSSSQSETEAPRLEPAGDGNYVVREGDCMQSIAAAHGWLWESLWDLPENRALRDARQDPNCLLPGDRVHVPEPRPRTESGATEQKHTFRRKGLPAMLRLQFQDEGEALANQPFVFRSELTEPYEGTTDGDGVAEVPIPTGARRGTLEVGQGDAKKVVEVDLGHLDPHDSVSGVQARLNNLGYGAGEVDGELNGRTERALRQFQSRQGLEITGRPDDETCDKLRELNGS
jgi:hypothetical protein